MQKCEVTALVRLQHLGSVQAVITTSLFRRHKIARPFRPAPRHLGLIYQQFYPLLAHRQANPVSVSYQRQRSTGRGLGRNVQHNRPESCAGHARIGNTDHILDTLRRQLFGDRKVARLRHARGAFRPGILQDHDVIGGYVEIRIVHPSREILERREDDGTPFLLE